jgi:hypothetical protein
LLVKIVMPLLVPLIAWLQPNGDVRTTWKSGGDVVRAAFDIATLGQHPNGTYLNGSSLEEPGPEARDTQKTNQLWRDSLDYAQVKEGDTILAEWH